MPTPLRTTIYLTPGVLLLLSLYGCFEQPMFVAKEGAGSVDHSPSIAVVATKESNDGVITAAFDASSNDVQVVEISNGSSALAGMSLSISPGTFAGSTSLAIQEGASLTSSVQSSSAGTGSVQAASAALVIKPSVKKDPIKPFSLALPISSSAGLNLAAVDTNNLVVACKYIKYSENEAVVLGILPASEFVISGDKVVFESSFFGAFQLLVTEKRVIEVKELKTSETVVTKTEEKAAASPSPSPSPSPIPTPSPSPIFVASPSPSPTGSNSPSPSPSGSPTPPQLQRADFYIKQLPANEMFTLKGIYGTNVGFTFNSLVDVGAAFDSINITAAGVVTLNSASLSTGTYQFNVNVVDTGNSTSFTRSFYVHIVPYRLCVWNGWVSNQWNDPANWNTCYNSTPISTDFIAVEGGTPALHINSASVTVKGIGAYPYGGGLIVIHDGFTLTLIDSIVKISSSVNILPSMDPCANCSLVLSSTGPYAVINEMAMVSLQGSIKLKVPNGKYLSLGDGVTAGSLTAWQTAGHVPTIMPVGGTWNGLKFEGYLGMKSSILTDGLKLQSVNPAGPAINFFEDYAINMLDNVHMQYSTPVTPNVPMLRFEACGSALINDLTWNNMNFDADLSAGAFNIQTACPAPPITVNNPNGPGAASAYADDYNFILNFIP